MISCDIPGMWHFYTSAYRAEYLGIVILNKGYEDIEDKSRLVGDINDTKQEKPDFAWCIAMMQRSLDIGSMATMSKRKEKCRQHG